MHDTSKTKADEPPPYSPHTASGSSSPSLPEAFKTKPTNFLTLYNDDSSIRGEFVIDPSLLIPSSILPPIGGDETDGDRKNLSLKSKNSSVQADIWLLGSSMIGDRKPRRTTISLISSHGSITSQVQTCNDAAPFELTARASHGGVRLALPRSFHGLICVSSRHGSITMSDAIVQNATQLSQLDNTRRYFVGDFQSLGEDAWHGDQVEIEAPHGSIRVKYVDELAESQGKKGLLNRLFRK